MKVKCETCGKMKHDTAFRIKNFRLDTKICLDCECPNRFDKIKNYINNYTIMPKIPIEMRDNNTEKRFIPVSIKKKKLNIFTFTFDLLKYCYILIVDAIILLINRK